MPDSYIQHRVNISNYLIHCSKIRSNKLCDRPMKIKITVLFIICLILSQTSCGSSVSGKSNTVFGGMKRIVLSGRECLQTSTYSKTLQVNHNSLMKSKNGNVRASTKLNLLQYNKGISNYKTKEPILNKVILDNNIDVACISEANITNSYLDNNNILVGYTCETNKMSEVIDVSRNVILIKDTITYKCRYNLEDPEIYSIWIEVNTSSRNSVLIMGGIVNGN